jgi:hypothetical protein
MIKQKNFKLYIVMIAVKTNKCNSFTIALTCFYRHHGDIYPWWLDENVMQIVPEPEKVINNGK